MQLFRIDVNVEFNKPMFSDHHGDHCENRYTCAYVLERIIEKLHLDIKIFSELAIPLIYFTAKYYNFDIIKTEDELVFSLVTDHYCTTDIEKNICEPLFTINYEVYKYKTNLKYINFMDTKLNANLDDVIAYIAWYPTDQISNKINKQIKISTDSQQSMILLNKLIKNYQYLEIDDFDITIFLIPSLLNNNDDFEKFLDNIADYDNTKKTNKIKKISYTYGMLLAIY